MGNPYKKRFMMGVGMIVLLPILGLSIIRNAVRVSPVGDSIDTGGDAQDGRWRESLSGKFRSDQTRGGSPKISDQKLLELEKESFFRDFQLDSKIVSQFLPPSSVDHPLVGFWAAQFLADNPKSKRRALVVFVTAASDPDERKGRLAAEGCGYLFEDVVEVANLMKSTRGSFQGSINEVPGAHAVEMIAAGKIYTTNVISPARYPNDRVTNSVIRELIELVKVSDNPQEILNVLNLLTYDVHKMESADWWVSKYFSLPTGVVAESN